MITLRLSFIAIACSLLMSMRLYAADVQAETVEFFSEGVQCKARLVKPANHATTAHVPGVVLAPGEGATRISIDRYAEALARAGIVALAIDYRGWGECGGFLYFAEPVRWDDRMRFVQLTASMRIRRGRIDPQAQLTDIRNAITYLQGVAGVDRARVGVWGADLAGGHVIAVAGMDARPQAVVAQVPRIAGRDAARVAFAPTAEQQATLIKLARTGAAPTNERAARAMNEDESRLALAQYRPYWYLEQIPQTTAVLFIVAEKDERIDNSAHAIAASKVLKGPASVRTINGAAHSLEGRQDEAAAAAAEWFSRHL